MTPCPTCQAETDAATPCPRCGHDPRAAASPAPGGTSLGHRILIALGIVLCVGAVGALSVFFRMTAPTP